jgi:hypothetical protein
MSMKRSGLFLITLFTILLTSFVLAQGGSRARSYRAALRRADLPCALRLDAAASEAACRYRNCQANHWRACLLQH